MRLMEEFAEGLVAGDGWIGDGIASVLRHLADTEADAESFYAVPVNVLTGLASELGGSYLASSPATADHVPDARKMVPALAHPEPQAPTEEALYDLAEEFNGDPVPAMRRALELWGRPAIAQPEPQGPTDLPPVQETAPERIFLHLNGANEWLPFKDEEGVVWSPDQIDESDIPYVRADLARWSHFTPQPVPISERLPGPEDCDAEGRCWWESPESKYIIYDMNPIDREEITTPPAYYLKKRHPLDTLYHRWLPHWALPVPGGCDAEAALG